VTNLDAITPAVAEAAALAETDGLPLSGSKRRLSGPARPAWVGDGPF
jgi:hypothetical protein